MKAVMFCSIKGGVGKTTLADEFAFSLDRTGVPYVFIDLDEQQTTLHEGHTDENPQVAVFDTPAGMAGDTLGMLDKMTADDVVVIVTRSSPKDVQTVEDAMKTVMRRTDAKIVFVINQASRFTIGKEFVAWFRANIEWDKYALIQQSDKVQQADALERSVIGFAKRTPVEEGMKEAITMIRTALGLGKELYTN